MPTLLDIAKANGSDAVVGLIDEAAREHPELQGAARTISGLGYKTLVRTGVPTGSSFRNANEGVQPIQGTYVNRWFETAIFDARWEADKAVADKYEDGANAYIAMEASGVMEGKAQDLCTQFYYGTASQAKGFPGLVQVVDPTMTISAGGVNALSSAWFVHWGPRDVQWLWGANGSFELSEVRVETLLDGNTPAGKYDGYVQTLLAYPGLQVASVYSVGRISNLSTDAGCGFTDDLVAQMMLTFQQVGKAVPTECYVHPRSIYQLQQSRTAVSPSGAPAPWPTESHGIRLVPTTAITVAE